ALARSIEQTVSVTEEAAHPPDRAGKRRELTRNLAETRERLLGNEVSASGLSGGEEIRRVVGTKSADVARGVAAGEVRIDPGAPVGARPTDVGDGRVPVGVDQNLQGPGRRQVTVPVRVRDGALAGVAPDDALLGVVRFVG